MTRTQNLIIFVRRRSLYCLSYTTHTTRSNKLNNEPKVNVSCSAQGW